MGISITLLSLTPIKQVFPKECAASVDITVLVAGKSLVLDIRRHVAQHLTAELSIHLSPVRLICCLNSMG